MVLVFTVPCVLDDHEPTPFLALTEASVMTDDHATFEDLREDVRRRHGQICPCGTGVGRAYLQVWTVYSGPRGHQVPLDMDEEVLVRLLGTTDKCRICFTVTKRRTPDETPKQPFNVVSKLICTPTKGKWHIPSLADRTFEALCNGRVFVNKLRFLELFKYTSCRFEVLRRPSGFGRTTFLSTLAYFHDLLPPTDGRDIQQYYHNASGWNRYPSVVLLLDFAQLDCSSVKTLGSSLSGILHETIRDAQKKYSDKIGADPNDFSWTPTSDATASLRHFVTRINDAGCQVFFGIDNYTEPFARLHDWRAVRAVLDDGLYSLLHELVANFHIRHGLLVGSPLAPSSNNSLDETWDQAELHEGCPCSAIGPEGRLVVPFTGALRGVTDECSDIYDYFPAMGMSQAEIEALGEVVLGDGPQFYEEVKKNVDPAVLEDSWARESRVMYSFTGVLSVLQSKGRSLQPSFL